MKLLLGQFAISATLFTFSASAVPDPEALAKFRAAEARFLTSDKIVASELPFAKTTGVESLSYQSHCVQERPQWGHVFYKDPLTFTIRATHDPLMGDSYSLYNYNSQFTGNPPLLQLPDGEFGSTSYTHSIRIRKFQIGEDSFLVLKGSSGNTPVLCWTTEPLVQKPNINCP